MATAGEDPPGTLSGEQPPLPLMILLYLRCDTLVALAALAVVPSGIAFGFVKGAKVLDWDLWRFWILGFVGV
jgi:hypothetical protein